MSKYNTFLILKNKYDIISLNNMIFKKIIKLKLSMFYEKLNDFIREWDDIIYIM